MPLKNKFIHLHTHTEYSLLDGACRITDVINKAKEHGMDSLAVTDHGNMYAAIEFYLKAKEAGIKPIVGCEFYVAPRTRFDKETKADRSPHHLTVLAKNLAGYKNMVKLASFASIEGFYSRPRIDRELIEKYHEGLIVLSGCPAGEVSRCLMNEDFAAARECVDWYRALLGDDYYLEIMDLGIPELKKLREYIPRLSKETGIPMVATNDVHCVNKADVYSQDVLVCIQTNAFLDDEKRLKIGTDEFYLKSTEEMSELFSDIPEAISNTIKVAEKCELEIETGILHLPNFEVPAGETPDTYVEKLTWQGIKKRYGDLLPPEVMDRVKYELYTIEKMGYGSYFLIVQDFINWAKEKGIQVGPGRGSAAGSIVSYALRITNIDPLKYNLIFERFLNIERISMPDIDIDFCFERRGEVIDYVTQKYGKDHVAQIITFGSMAARAAIRDVGRVQRIPLPEVDRMAKLIPFGPEADLDLALETVKEFREIYDKDEKIKKLIDTARSLEGMVRHASVHAAGVVISEYPLNEYVPLQKLDENVIVTQYPMNYLEKIGLLKMDFLGLRNLTMIAQTVEILKQTQKIDLDINAIPLDDLPTYKLFNSGETIGVFQLESSGMRALIKDLKPTSFEEIIALLALYRPGPLESGMVEDYVKRKHNKVPIKYELPELQPILRETYGVILYQEQVMEIASKIGGFSMGQADVLRAAMGKKKVKEMAQQKEFFIEGAVKKGFSKKKATDLFDLCAKFAGYGFNKSHSTCYAMISYQTAYLKANYPAEFMAALLTSITGNTDKVRLYISESQKMKIKVLGPDINESEKNFAVTRNGIRFGLAAVKNVGIAAIDNIISTRKENGNYDTFSDFCRKIDARTVNKKVFESLIKAGAFDSFGESRSFLLARYEKRLSKASVDRKELSSGQEMLFSTSENKALSKNENEIVDYVEHSQEALLKMEKDLLGFYISSHPLQNLRETIELLSNCQMLDIPEKREGEPIKACGMISDGRKIVTKKGDMMFIGKLEDLTGNATMVIFPKTYAKYAGLLNNDEIVLVKGKLNRDPRTEELNIMVDEVDAIAQIEKIRSLHLEVFDVSDKSFLSELREQLALEKGNDPVFIRMDGKSIELGKESWVEISPSLIEKLEALLGGGAVSVQYTVKKKENAIIAQ